MMEEKLSGVYAHKVDYKRSILFRGFDDVFYVPHSRYTTVSRAEIENTPGLRILASSEKAGVYAVTTPGGRQIFVTGHSEYDGDTLKKEYTRDKLAGINPNIPENYFPNDDDTREPIISWRAHATLLFTNWLNYFVYQTTPYDIVKIADVKASDDCDEV
jgi:homoserine O-succinyltransferase